MIRIILFSFFISSCGAIVNNNRTNNRKKTVCHLGCNDSRLNGERENRGTCSLHTLEKDLDFLEQLVKLDEGAGKHANYLLCLYVGFKIKQIEEKLRLSQSKLLDKQNKIVAGRIEKIEAAIIARKRYLNTENHGNKLSRFWKKLKGNDIKNYRILCDAIDKDADFFRSLTKTDINRYSILKYLVVTDIMQLIDYTVSVSKSINCTSEDKKFIIKNSGYAKKCLEDSKSYSNSKFYPIYISFRELVYTNLPMLATLSLILGTAIFVPLSLLRVNLPWFANIFIGLGTIALADMLKYCIRGFLVGKSVRLKTKSWSKYI